MVHRKNEELINEEAEDLELIHKSTYGFRELRS